jgi:flagellar hook-length control protein FliK
LKQFSDGTHRLSIQMRPDDLGTVNVEFALTKGTLHLHVVAESSSARDAISGSLSQLRAEIEASGVRTGSFGVGAQASGDRRFSNDPQRANRSSRAYSTGGVEGIDAPVAITRPQQLAMDGRLDLRI